MKNTVLFTFLLIPFVSAQLPIIRITPNILLTGPRIFHFVFFFLIIALCIRRKFKLKIPEYLKWLIFVFLFSILNRFIQQTGTLSTQYAQKGIFDGFLFPIFSLILIENLNYNKNDLKKFINILKIVAVGTFIASFMQIFINPFFYQGNTPGLEKSDSYYSLYNIAGDIFRNRSIFIGMQSHDASIAIICLGLIFLFLNRYKYNKVYVTMVILLTFSGIVTFSRFVWLSIIVGIILFLFYKYKNKLIIILGVLSILFFLSYNVFFGKLENTDIYQKRIIAGTYISRINDPVIYFKYFFAQKPFFGYGISSYESPKFRRFDRPIIHNNLLNTMFKNGIFGLFLFSVFVYHLYKRAQMVFKTTGNKVFIVFVVIYIIINILYPISIFNYYGYYVMFLYLAMNYNIYVKNKNVYKPHDNKILIVSK